VLNSEDEDLGLGLPPGSRHHRAFVGPPEDYDTIAALQFTLLAVLGLREHHSVLDIGCGSLRAGRLFIAYLRRARYFGIEPEERLVQAGIERETGRDLVRLKQPTFSTRSDFALSSFGRQFDYLMAQSIFSHAASGQVRRCFEEARRVMHSDSVFAANFLPGPTDAVGDGWVYDHNVTYTPDGIVAMAAQAGLVCKLIAWPHPRLKWMLLTTAERPVNQFGYAAALSALGPDWEGAGRAVDIPDAGATTVTWNQYHRELTDEEIVHGAHRDFVGGLWNELGLLQRDFLIAQGLKPTDDLLDVGCGCLRAGVHFIRFLDPGRYHGVDSNASLLKAGLEVEVPRAGLQDRLPTGNLLCDDRFQFSLLGKRFGFALAQSLFTHLPLNHIRLCLIELARCMDPGGRFFATYFESPKDEPWEQPRRQPPAGLETFADRDPFHYRFSDLVWCAAGLDWSVRRHGEWGHPRGQVMAEFTRGATGKPPGQEQ